MFTIGYIVNNLRVAIPSLGFKGRDFGTIIISNVGVFGMKKGFAPLVGLSGVGMFIAMGSL